MNAIIRPLKMSDASDLHEIRSSEGSRENTLGLITNKVMRTEKMLANLNENNHLLVAGVDGKVVGSAGRKINQSP